jgi:hypothetical protein
MTTCRHNSGLGPPSGAAQRSAERRPKHGRAAAPPIAALRERGSRAAPGRILGTVSRVVGAAEDCCPPGLYNARSRAKVGPVGDVCSFAVVSGRRPVQSLSPDRVALPTARARPRGGRRPELSGATPGELRVPFGGGSRTIGALRAEKRNREADERDAKRTSATWPPSSAT